MAGQPARGYSRAPFSKGNTAALVHGANHPPTVEARAALVHRDLLAVAPHLDDPLFLPAVDRYLQTTAVEKILRDHIFEVCARNGPAAVPVRLWESLTAVTRSAAKQATDLGLDPLGHARLRATAANAEVSSITLADLIAQGDSVRRNAEARTVDAAAAVRPAEALEGSEATMDSDEEDEWP